MARRLRIEKRQASVSRQKDLRRRLRPGGPKTFRISAPHKIDDAVHICANPANDYAWILLRAANSRAVPSSCAAFRSAVAHALRFCNSAFQGFAQAGHCDDGRREGIRSRLRTSGKTQRQLAAALGIDASGVSRLLDGGRKLRDDELVRIRAFFDPAADAPAAPPTTYRLGPAPGDTRLRRPRPGPEPMRRADIPVYGPPIGRGDPFLRFAPGPLAQYRARPDQLLGVVDAFAIFAPGDLLMPRYRSAEVLYVHPRRPPVVGSDCLLRMKTPEGAVAILRYLGENENAIGFSAVTSPHSCAAVPRSEIITILRRDVAQIGRIALISAE